MTSKHVRHIFIALPGRTDFTPAGRFRLSETEEGAPCGEFAYARSYLECPDAVELDPVQLRLTARPYRTTRLNGFFGAIRDAMPDQWGRRVLDRQHGGPHLDEFDYLVEAPDDRAGALGFAPGPAPPFPRQRFPGLRDLERLSAAAQAVAGANSEPAEATVLGATLMGGARPKTVVEDGNVLWLMKFARAGDCWNVPRAEHGLLLLARECGLDTAASRIVHTGGHDMLLVRRFDRERVETGYRRHRMVSALTVLEAEDRPEDRERWSYLLLADRIRRVSACPGRDLRELFARLCFNAAVSNLDDHPRNHAFLGPGHGWRLSPAYDLNPVPLPGPGLRELAMTCGLRGRRATGANLLSGHARFHLSRERAALIFGHVTATVGARWYKTMRRAGVSERDCETIGPAFLHDGLFGEDTAA